MAEWWLVKLRVEGSNPSSSAKLFYRYQFEDEEIRYQSGTGEQNWPVVQW
jgi:hypothetical protein